MKGLLGEIWYFKYVDSYFVKPYRVLDLSEARRGTSKQWRNSRTVQWYSPLGACTGHIITADYDLDVIAEREDDRCVRAAWATIDILLKLHVIMMTI